MLFQANPYLYFIANELQIQPGDLKLLLYLYKFLTISI